MNKKSFYYLLFFLLAMIICLFVRNSTLKKSVAILTKDITLLTENISMLVDRKYEESKKIDIVNFRYRIDSIYVHGNELCENLESKNFAEKHSIFYTKFGDELLKTSICKNKLCVKTQIKIQQLFVIDDELSMEYQSHFDSRIISVYANSRDAINNGKPLKLIVSYSSLLERHGQYPIITIGNDTLKKHPPYYILENTQNIKHEKNIDIKITTQSWGSERVFFPIINWGSVP